MFSKEYEMQQLYMEYLFDRDPKDYLQQGRNNHQREIIGDGIYDFSLLGVNLESMGLLWYSHKCVANEFEKLWACVELYGHYASKQNRLNSPIFNYKNYRSAGIEFHIFFICSRFQRVKSKFCCKFPFIRLIELVI